ncbi:anthranilate synthase component I [Haladaptatus paucihalophilus DX253]|uniref:anthranilate synthase n=1 Tax=Haladaptatus paucihalophilus DX253 TaxID=797209 RepID=E7QUX5_HALPU|nr:anthranilate synthase component I family protein [Haladaptatus paucihalophilus]EFW91782.1 anthranilate synthase component I [Haladaptatus paucihalophilus DX253]SHJ94126.1 aminodeoxychorismate synthase, subunit I [Haladaptatus paucihalophilus DX253]
MVDEISVITRKDEFESVASGLEGDARIPVEVRITVDDPYTAYRKARFDSEGAYLETTGGQDGWGYFGIEPAYWLTKSDDEPDSFERLEELLNGERLVRGDCDVPYPCGAFGWLSYDIARELEDLPDTTDDDRSLPRLQFGVYDLVSAWKEPRDGDGTELRITCCPRVAPDDDFASVYADARSRLEAHVGRIRDGDPSVEHPPVDGPISFRNEVGQEEYSDRIRTVKRYIRDGDTFQANISQRLSAPAAVHPTDVFGALREVNPAPYSGILEFPGVDLVSTSPELLLDCEGRRLVTEPIAGTRPRGETTEEDEELESDLLANEKEHAEHTMLVDLERNDLGKVAEYGSVEVTDFRRIDRYSEVMHTVSVVEGVRRDDQSIPDSIAAVFPGGTITGAPKPRTMEIIDEVEFTRRGPYTGAIGVLGFDDRATLNMTIRTLVRTSGRYYLRVGAGIVHDSEPVAEFYETLDKGRALINAVSDALDDDADLELEVGDAR